KPEGALPEGAHHVGGDVGQLLAVEAEAANAAGQARRPARLGIAARCWQGKRPRHARTDVPDEEAVRPAAVARELAAQKRELAVPDCRLVIRAAAGWGQRPLGRRGGSPGRRGGGPGPRPARGRGAAGKTGRGGGPAGGPSAAVEGPGAPGTRRRRARTVGSARPARILTGARVRAPPRGPAAISGHRYALPVQHGRGIRERR